MNPKSECHTFHAKQAPYALIVGVYNEGDAFIRQLEALQPYRNLADILIADGGSTDGATAPVGLRGKACCLLVNTDAQRGLSVQYRIALRYALEQGYEGVVMMDGNGKDGPDAIPAFIRALEDGFDFVQGSRFMRGGVHEHTPLLRMLGIRLVFNPMLWLATGYAYTDGMNGFKACSRAFLLHQGVQPLRHVFVRYGLQYYLNYRAAKLGVRLCEIPVTRRYRGGKTPQSKIVGYKAYLSILGELLSTVTGRYDPASPLPLAGEGNEA